MKFLRKLPVLKYFYLFFQRLGSLESTTRILNIRLNKIIELSSDDYIRKYLYEHPNYLNTDRLNRYEYKVYSQNGEDGIICEIFRRIGETNKYFVEFGVENGLETNSTYLLLKDWQGLWMEGDSEKVESMKKRFSSFFDNGRLRVKNTFITKENIEDLLLDAQVPNEPDLLAIDIDGNDYWVWKAITKFKPRVVIIEYNATFRPDVDWIMKYKKDYVWDKKAFSGASLLALERLGRSKGYRLVCCDFSVVKAFFV